MDRSSGSARKARLIAAGALALLAAAFTIFFLFRTQESPPAIPGAGGGPEAASRAAGDAKGAVASPAAAAEVVAEPKSEETPPAEAGPPLLSGRVLGEGQGIAGASVRLFSTKRIQECLERLETLGPSGGEFPDIPLIVSTARSELEKVRSSAIAATSEAGGRYEFPKIEPGGYLVLTVASGWLLRFGDVVSLAKERAETLDLEIQRGSTIGGRVVDGSGTGLGGIQVTAEIRLSSGPGLSLIMGRIVRYLNGEFLRGAFEASSGPDGSFTIPSLPPGLYDLGAEKPGGPRTRLQGVETGSQDALILFGIGAVARGVLADQEGTALPGVTLKLEEKDDQLQLPLPMAAFGDVASSIHRLLGDGPRVVKAGRGGEFRLGPLSPGKHRLWVEDRGFLPFSQTFEIDWGQNLNLGSIRLDRGETIVGVVQSEGGAPLVGAKVSATIARANLFSMGSTMNDLFSGRTSAVTDGAGSFKLGGLVRGKYRLSATCPGFAAAQKAEAATGGEPVVLVLKPGVRLSGRVVESPEGKPLSGVKVAASGVRTETAEDGRFTLEGVAPADDSLTPFLYMAPQRETPRKPSRKVQVTARAQGFVGADEEVDLEGGSLDLEIQLSAVPEVKGQVLDPEGKPAPGCLVRLGPEMKPGEFPPGFDFFDPSLIFLAVTVSDLEGRFHFRNFPGATPGARYQATADHPVHARGISEGFSLPQKPDEGKEIEVRLVQASGVKGVVTDGKSPVAGAAVRLRKVSPKSADGGAHEMESMMTGMLGLPKGGTVIYTGREGEFHYERLVPGSYQIEAELAGHTESPSQPFTLGPGETREVSLVVDPGGEISGEVVDPRGKPIPQARVRLLKLPKEGKEVKEGFDSQGALEFQKMMGGSYRSATTGEDGAFQITGLRQDRFLVLASAPGYTGGELSGVSPGPKRQKIVLTPAATLRGLVTDLANGRPITRFRLALDREEGEGSPMNPLADFTAEHQDGDGRFNQEDLAPGKYEVSVAASGYAPLRKKVVLAAGGSLEESFPLAQAGRIRGTVVEEETGLPLSGARITVEGSGPEERSRKRPRKQGKVRIQVTAAAEPPAEGPAPEEEEAMAHHFTHEFLDEEGTSSGEDGSFLLESVPEGTQVILASHPDYVPTVSEEIEVRSGQEVSLDFSLPRGLAISGKVVGSSGEPAPGTMLFLHRVGEEVPPLEKHAMSGEEGRFRFAGLEKGSYRLSPLQSFKASPEGASAQAKREPLVIELREDQTGIEVRLPPASE